MLLAVGYTCRRKYVPKFDFTQTIEIDSKNFNAYVIGLLIFTNNVNNKCQPRRLICCTDGNT